MRERKTLSLMVRMQYLQVYLLSPETFLNQKSERGVNAIITNNPASIAASLTANNLSGAYPSFYLQAMLLQPPETINPIL
jgi:L-cystine uptake protein TcyP (sodium:dicarboxylate symporter family)